VFEDERIRVEAEAIRRVKERRVEEALPEDEPERQKDHHRGDGDHRAAREAEGAGGHLSCGALFGLSPRRRPGPNFGPLKDSMTNLDPGLRRDDATVSDRREASPLALGHPPRPPHTRIANRLHLSVGRLSALRVARFAPTPARVLL